MSFPVEIKHFAVLVIIRREARRHICLKREEACLSDGGITIYPPPDLVKIQIMEMKVVRHLRLQVRLLIMCSLDAHRGRKAG